MTVLSKAHQEARRVLHQLLQPSRLWVLRIPSKGSRPGPPALTLAFFLPDSSGALGYHGLPLSRVVWEQVFVLCSHLNDTFCHQVCVCVCFPPPASHALSQQLGVPKLSSVLTATGGRTDLTGERLGAPELPQPHPLHVLIASCGSPGCPGLFFPVATRLRFPFMGSRIF